MVTKYVGSICYKIYYMQVFLSTFITVRSYRVPHGKVAFNSIFIGGAKTQKLVVVTKNI